ncbi:FAD-binding domain-containing protein [Paracoccus cavernae]|uniref:FAD-binding domain-containing protein n=1 Tax=Paracoccus cavernae TaxID=1571207 RepID=A0ABT8DF16_9RHOB|nr:FAD-binding domain-containing protein [Paracoccus cavernae]
MGGLSLARDPRDLADWRQARTGVALVDAGLREMWLSGRMHNRVRMVVASWLTKHLLIDWRAGLAHFADCLTDWDPAANAMNWQWVAGCGPDASPFFRIFNPEKQARQFDPEGRYRARWLEGYGLPAPDGPEARAYREAIPRAWLERDPRDPATAAVAGWQGQETGQGAAALAGHLAQGRARAGRLRGFPRAALAGPRPPVIRPTVFETTSFRERLRADERHQNEP